MNYALALGNPSIQNWSHLSKKQYSKKKYISYNKLPWGTSLPPNLFIKSAHRAILGSLGLLMVEMTLGQSPETISKKNVKKMVPYPKCFFFVF